MEVATAGTRHASGGPAQGDAVPEPAAGLRGAGRPHPGRRRRSSIPRATRRSRSTEVRDMAYRVAGGLASLGIGKGDTVAIMLNNRWEFIPIDLGAAYLGGVPFSIYQTSSPEQIQYVCEDADGDGDDHRVRLPRRLQRGEEGPAGARARHRDRRRRRHPHARGPRRHRSRLQRARVRRGHRPGGLPHADLHVGHHRTAQGRPADPAQPDDAGRRASTT